MANTVITPIDITEGSLSTIATLASSTAIVAANTHSIAFPKQGRLEIEIQNTFAGEKVVTVAAGDKIGAKAETLKLAQDAVATIYPDSSKHKDANGNVVITVASGTTGTIRAKRLV